MTPVEEAISVCSWIKQLTPTTRNGVVFHYRTIDSHLEITILDNLDMTHLFTEYVPHRREPPESDWYHICLTWSFRSKTVTLYYNGAQEGTNKTQSNRKLYVTTGSIV